MNAGAATISDLSAAHGTTKAVNVGAAFLVFVAYIAAQILTAIAVGFIEGIRVGLRGGVVRDPATLEQLLRAIEIPSFVGGTTIAGVILLLLVRRLPGVLFTDRSREGIGWALGTNRAISVGAISGAMLGIGYLIASSLIPPPPDFPNNLFAHSATWTTQEVVLVCATVVLIAPPLEELLFRGVLFSGVARRWGYLAGGIVSTSLFVLVHWSQTSAYWPALLAITLLGISTIALRIRTSALGPSVALHVAYNSILMGTLALQ